MMQRCYSSYSEQYVNYGARGILVCDRWHEFTNFLQDMGEAPKGRSLERINNDGNYEPGNCRWATPSEQARNKRNTRLLTHNGETLPVSDWADRLGCHAKVITKRLKRGWNPSEAVSIPSGLPAAHSAEAAAKRRADLYAEAKIRESKQRAQWERDLATGGRDEAASW